MSEIHIKYANKNNQTESSAESETLDGFTQELLERARIKQGLQDFKEIVDAKKAEKLRDIEEDNRIRREKASNSISALQAALSNSDPDQIKSALKDMLT